MREAGGLRQEAGGLKFVDQRLTINEKTVNRQPSTVRNLTYER